MNFGCFPFFSFLFFSCFLSIFLIFLLEFYILIRFLKICLFYIYADSSRKLFIKSNYIFRDGSHASILWSSNEGLLRSDVTGENIDTLVSKTSLKESESEFHIVDVSWYKDVLYIVGNNSALYRYNVSNHQKTKLLNIHSVGSVAVDWLSKKLYWANPKQQIVNIIKCILTLKQIRV